ncbi:MULTISPECIES: hypothetical protein [unclassified Sutcliffiella]|uniref:hypothetical protein n=1 Tax=unclassified Sutcliffiella TaxID=2837532 RepID=UPI0030CD09EE
MKTFEIILNNGTELMVENAYLPQIDEDKNRLSFYNDNARLVAMFNLDDIQGFYKVWDEDEEHLKGMIENNNYLAERLNTMLYGYSKVFVD